MYARGLINLISGFFTFEGTRREDNFNFSLKAGAKLRILVMDFQVKKFTKIKLIYY